MDIRVKNFYEGGGVLTESEKTLLRTFIPENQLKNMSEGMTKHWRDIIAKMPATMQTDNLSLNEKTVYLHYYYGDHSWFIVKKDIGQSADEEAESGLEHGKQYQAFGYDILDGDTINAEWGYISIQKLIDLNCLLDLTWKPKPFKEAIEEYYEKQESDKRSSPFEENLGSGEETTELPDSRLIRLLNYLNKTNNTVSKAIMWNDGEYEPNGNMCTASRGFCPTSGKTLWQIALAQGLPVETSGREKSIDFNGYDLADAILKETGVDFSANLHEYDKHGRIIDKDAAETVVATHENDTKTIRALIDAKGDDRSKYSDEELKLIRRYDGLGGLARKGYAEREILDQYFTPHNVIAKMWGLALKYGFNPNEPKYILEPAAGTGRMLEYLPNPEIHWVDMYEIDKYSAIIAKLGYPMFNVHNKSFETLFFQGKRHLGMINVNRKYDLVISNPPYREFNSEFSDIKNDDGQTEKSITKAQTFDQYFTMRSVDLLKPRGLLVTILPNTFLSNNNKYNDFKDFLILKTELIDAFRLPNNTFFNTSIGTDVLVIRKK